MTPPVAIAIVGRGCVLPGALDPAGLWTRVRQRDDLTGPSTQAMWGLHPADVCSDPREPSACARGGYVSGFDALWRPDGFAVAAERLATLPVGWKWLIHATREALNEASFGMDGGARAGLVVGTLGYATRALADVAARRWCGDLDADSPALSGQTGALHWTLAACGLDGPRIALDAACASGLYALKIACDALQSRRADLMIAAGLNAADDLFLHIGFTALGALSRTGRSSPLSSLADGLLPAEGAAVLALKRLDDAVAAGDRIYGVVRGVGLSNDGRGPGLLAPTTSGQQRAVRAAYAAAALSPTSVEYLECHATGTAVGDREEMLSVRAVFGEDHPLRLGSLKAQLGHLITASAGAGLLKICGAFEHDTMPAAPQVSVEHPMEALQGSALRLPGEAAEWKAGSGPRRAAINAFGFGGCNAHAVIDGPEVAAELVRKPRGRAKKKPLPEPRRHALALVACEVAVGAAPDTTATLRVLLGLDAATRRIGDLQLGLKGLGFPPADLQQTLPQQLMLLRAAQAMRPHLEGLDRDRVGVFVGTDVDPAGARHGCRWRLEQFLGRPCREAERTAVVPPLQAAGVVGTMPNMPANRLNSALDLRGPGMVVSDGFASGGQALELAADAIARGELDAALVGAVDASGGAFGDDPSRADTAVLLLLMPARSAGTRDVLATFTAANDDDPTTVPTLPWSDAGEAHELLQLAVAALCCRHALSPSSPADPWLAADRHLRMHGWEIRAPRVQGLAEEAPRLPDAAAAEGAVDGSRQTADGQEAARPASEVAWVFTGAAAAYPGAGRQLLRAFPELGSALRAMAPRLTSLLPALMGQGTLTLIDQLQLATMVSQAQAQLLRRVGLVPGACLGLSSGETNALIATGAWTDADDLFADVSRSGMYDEHLAGDYETLRAAWSLDEDATPDWRCYRVTHPVDAIRSALATRPRVRLLIVHHGTDVVIGGEDAACRELVSSLGARAVPINHDLVVHCPELEPFADTWYRVHHRDTQPITTPRLYANAVNRSFAPTAHRCAEMLTEQARHTVIFDATVKQAYEDGIRCFVELGPRNACTGWIREILADQPHVACAVDGTRGTIRETADALTIVANAGYTVDTAWWNAQMAAIRLLPAAAEAAASSDSAIRLPGHRALPTFDARTPAVLRMPQAPALAPALPDRLLSVGWETAGWESAGWEPAGWENHDVPAPLFETSMDVAALVALSNCQQALLQVQQLAIQHLIASAPAEIEPVTFAATAVPDVQIVEAAAIDDEASATLEIPAVTFTREQLEVHASGRISEIFGPAFAAQDSHPRQVRMPMPPLLLADRVVGLLGEPASMRTGRIWTETDVRPDSWYLHEGRMPTGILIESGQADLMLISWLGVDLHNRGDRVYRLLGCELTFHGQLPAIGETLRYEISIDGHARHGEVGLFFFHYDCKSDGQLRLSVREGQAGFFTDEELDESAGVLWNPADDQPDPAAPLAGPRPGVTPAASYGEAQVAGFADGDVMAAFGPAFLRCASHTRTPRIANGRLRLFDRVDELDLQGGPWGRGYLRATMDVTPEAWFFPGHFYNDPCMPGTLMFEGCLQTMAFYVAALGYTIDRDGWRFEPVPEQPYLLRCRGQVTPKSRTLVYEVFVSELHDGAEPMLVADLMCTVDGLRAFHCRRMALRLTPDAPLSAYDLSQIAPDAEPVAEYDGFRYGQASLLACATGNPVAAFGPLYATLPPTRRVPRLPAPPYHFISRISSLSHPPGGMQAGVIVETAYDIPPDAWYFDAHPTGQMPSCVLIEAALQPCGWLASYVGCAVHEADEVFFRNLDGKGVLHRAVRADDGCLRVRSRLKSISRAGGMTLVGFDVVCAVGDEVIYELGTTFGFFPKTALEGQTGLAAEPAERAFADTSAELDLLDQLGPKGRERLPKPAVRMCERVTHRQIADDGRAMLRGEKRVRPDEWFFKAHFFQDPVQPGSLGIEALVQLLQAHLLLEGAAEAVPGGVFADLVTPDPTSWQFRGQVMPEASLVSLTLDADPIEKADGRWSVRAQGSVWVDGRRIYQVKALTVSMAAVSTPGGGGTVRLDPVSQPWWNDHRPTYAAPVLPGMAVLSLAMQAAPDVVGVDDLVLRRWLVLNAPTTLTIGVEGDALAIAEDGRALADGRLVRGPLREDAPEPLPPLPSTTPALEDPYASGAMFHGPAYQRVVEGRRDRTGCDIWVRVDAEQDARERVPHIVLDAGLHGVPHDAMERWFPEVAPGQIAYPARVERFRLFAAVPRDGVCEVRVRPAGFHGSSHRFPRLLLHLLREGQLWAELVLVEACLPATGLGRLPGESRRAFLRDGQFVPGARLSHEADGTSVLTQSELSSADWLPGTVQTLYGLSPSEPLPRLQAVVAREHAAARVRLHPRAIAVDRSGRVQASALPLLDYRLTVSGDDRRATAADVVAPRLDIATVSRWWEAQTWQARVPALRDLFLAACRHFVGGVRLIDPAAMAALGNSPLLLLANHQVAVESVLAGMALPPVLGRPLLTLAKQEHRDTWVGRLAAGLNDDRRGPAIVYVDRDRQQDMLERLAEMSQAAKSGARSLMVHVEGTRAVHGRQPVATISAVWADMAVQAGLTIVPLRFCSGLPLAGADRRIEFPFGLGAQELVLGRPLASTELAGLPLNARRDRILAGLAELEPYDLEPAPDAGFGARVHLAQQRWSLDEVRAVFLLLQAEAQAWPLDDQGLPSDAMAARDASDPFWEWFEQHTAAAQP